MLTEINLKKDSYPYLGEGHDGLLVLFTSPKCGTVLSTKSKAYSVNEYFEHFNEKAFTSPSSITIVQE